MWFFCFSKDEWKWPAMCLAIMIVGGMATSRTQNSFHLDFGVSEKRIPNTSGYPKFDGWSVDHDVPDISGYVGGTLHFWTHPNQQMSGYVLYHHFSVCFSKLIDLIVWLHHHFSRSFHILSVLSPSFSQLRPRFLDQPSYGHRSKPMMPYLGGWTSINPIYFYVH